jgi:hypothetical protein
MINGANRFFERLERDWDMRIHAPTMRIESDEGTWRKLDMPKYRGWPGLAVRR